MNTIESKVPSSAEAPEQSLDQDMWLDTALEDTFPASDPISTFHADGAIFIREAHPKTITGFPTTTPADGPTATRRTPV
jgi:hypothetical protein